MERLPALFKSMGQVPKTMTAANFPVSDSVEEDDYVEKMIRNMASMMKTNWMTSTVMVTMRRGRRGEEREESNGYEDEY
jgi:hypothetical protein